jgi:hypothetical protein
MSCTEGCYFYFKKDEAFALIEAANIILNIMSSICPQKIQMELPMTEKNKWVRLVDWVGQVVKETEKSIHHSTLTHIFANHPKYFEKCVKTTPTKTGIRKNWFVDENTILEALAFFPHFQNAEFYPVIFKTLYNNSKQGKK